MSRDRRVDTFALPDLGEGLTEAEIVSWLVEVGDEITVDRSLDDARADDYDALVLPGGVANPDFLRTDETAVAFVREPLEHSADEPAPDRHQGLDLPQSYDAPRFVFGKTDEASEHARLVEQSGKYLCHTLRVGRIDEGRHPFITLVKRVFLACCRGRERMTELMQGAPTLEIKRTDQIAALPLGGRIRVNPWDNTIQLIKAKPVELLSAREKMPFEVTPVFLYLTRVKTSDSSAQATAKD